VLLQSIAIVLDLTLISNYGVSIQNRIDVSLTNSPGISCQKIELAMVYAQPTVSSRVLGRTQDFIAVTGKDVNGFFPIITGSRVKGWVMVNQTFQGKSFEARPCKVQIQPDGHLIFEQP